MARDRNRPALGWTIPEGWVPVKKRMAALREQRERARDEAARASPAQQVQAA
jgi:hypothetical protein